MKIEMHWVIHREDTGFYYGTNSATRRGAIAKRIEWTDDEWRDLYRRGDRAVRVVLAPLLKKEKRK